MTPGESHTEKQLLKNVSEGDELAFASLVNIYWRNIFLHALTYARSAQKAEEITQDIFLVVWNSRDKLPGLDSFAAWLHVVARNKIVSAMRQKVRQIAVGDEYPKDTIDPLLVPDQQLESREAYRLLLKGIDLLPEKRREVFKLSRLEGLSNLEIAEQLQIHPVTVGQYLAKALVFLKTYLNEYQINTIAAIIALGGFR